MRRSGPSPWPISRARRSPIAEAGLRARARPGAGGLVPGRDAFSLRAQGQRQRGAEVPADELIRRYETDWAGDVTRVFAEYSY